MLFFFSAGFFIGVAAAIKFSAIVASRLSTNGHLNGKWLPFLSFVLVFSIVVISMHYLGKLFQKTSELIMMGWLNKIGGICLFVLLYGIIFSVLLFYANQLHLFKKETINSSYFYPYISPLAPDVINSMGKIIPFFKDLFVQLEGFFNTVSNKI
jgi:membrane protein required for colicin V production